MVGEGRSRGYRGLFARFDMGNHRSAELVSSPTTSAGTEARVAFGAQEAQTHAVFRKSCRLIDGDRIIYSGLRVPRSRFRRPRDYSLRRRGRSNTARAADKRRGGTIRTRGKSQIRRKDRPQYDGTPENVICNAAIAVHTRWSGARPPPLFFPRALALIQFGRKRGSMEASPQFIIVVNITITPDCTYFIITFIITHRDWLVAIIFPPEVGYRYKNSTNKQTSRRSARKIAIFRIIFVISFPRVNFYFNTFYV